MTKAIASSDSLERRAPDASSSKQEGSTNLVSKQKSGYSKTFYKRVLPCPPAIAFSSSEGKQIFREALADGTMEGFFKLIEQFSTQDEPAFCGLASLAMVLNSLSIDPRRPWKGPWRYFHEELLDCCRPLERVKEEGITLQEAACLARCNGAEVSLRRHSDLTLGQLRDMVADSCCSEREHLVVSYSRKTMLQTGDGHFSPVGGYHRGRDLVLILDTARFKYPPHWAPLSLLYQAMGPLDPATGLPRGVLRITSNGSRSSVMFTLNPRCRGWPEAQRLAEQVVPTVMQQMKEGTWETAEQALAQLVGSTTLDSLGSFMSVRASVLDAASAPATTCTQSPCSRNADSCEQLLLELRATLLFKAVATALEAMGHGQAVDKQDLVSERLTMLLYLLLHDAWQQAGESGAAQALKQLVALAPGSNVAVEVEYLKGQWQQLPLIQADASKSEMESHCVYCATAC